MAEIQKMSPKKIPIDDWVKSVKKLDASSLKDEEKKVFEMVRAHKNIPKTPTKFNNFCVHNLKVKNEKLINKIWGHLSVALHDQAPQAKVTKDDKKSKLEKKLGPKKSAVSNGHSEGKDGDQGDVKPGKKQNIQQKKVDKKGKNQADDSNNELPKKVVPQKGSKAAIVEKKNQTQEKKNKIQEQKNKAHEQKGKSPNQKVFEQKQKVVEQKGKPAEKKAVVLDQKNKNKQQNAKTTDKQLNNGVEKNAKQQDMKKKVSFSKKGSPNDNKVAKKSEQPAKVHKPTPKKPDPKKAKLDLKNKKGKKQEDDEDDDDDEISDDSEMDFGSSDDEEMSDDDLDDSDDEDLEDEDLDDEELTFDEDDDDDDEEEDDE